MIEPPVLDLYRHSFRSFVEFVYRELHPGVEFIDNWHIDVIADRLMNVPHRTRRLMINVPPRYLKSLMASIAWPLFMCAHYPGIRISICVGTHDLAMDFDAQRRRLLASPRLRAIFPNLRVTGAPGRLRFVNGSEIVQTVVLRSQMGRGADIYVIDDPISAADAEKPRQRQAVHDWYSKEVVRGLNKKASAAVVIVMQRLHIDDLCSSVLTPTEPWEQLVLSALPDRDECWTLVDGRKISRPAYQPLSPKLESEDDLYKILVQIRGVAFYAQYLQKPQHNGCEVRGGGRGALVYEGWEPGLELAPWKVFVNVSEDIFYDHFGVADPGWRPGRRTITTAEWNAHFDLLGQRQAMLRADCYTEFVSLGQLVGTVESWRDDFFTACARVGRA